MKTKHIKELKAHYIAHYNLCPQLCQLYLDKIREYEKTTKKTV